MSESEKPATSVAKELFSLSDAVSLYQKQVDVVHKFWNYLWLISSAVVTAVGLSANEHTATLGIHIWKPLLAGFVAFAVFNGILLFLAQKEARSTAGAIDSYVKAILPTPLLFPEFGNVLSSLSSWDERLVLLCHVLIDSFVVFCVLSLVGQAPWQ